MHVIDEIHILLNIQEIFRDPRRFCPFVSRSVPADATHPRDMSWPRSPASRPATMLTALRTLPRTVWLLGAVSLLNDAASDLVHPLLPLFLATLPGGGAQALGLIEGCAEAVASLLKLASGVLADRHGRVRLWVFCGYGLAALARPLIALATVWPMVLALRVLDRIGKGLRSSPRDALLARSVEPARRGLAFGVHRAMDNAGAVAGPLLAAALLAAGVPVRELFLWTLVPGALTLWLVWRVPEPPAPAIDVPKAAPRTSMPLPPALRRFLALHAVFSLGSASNLFLLLRAQELGLADAALPLLWALVSAVATLASVPLSGLSDRLGRRTLLVGGWGLQALLYGWLGWPGLPATALWPFAVLLGLYLAATEGTAKALIADRAPADSLGRAFGWYYLISGLCLLPASWLTGALWSAFGAGAACAWAGGCTGLAALMLFLTDRS